MGGGAIMDTCWNCGGGGMGAGIGGGGLDSVRWAVVVSCVTGILL